MADFIENICIRSTRHEPDIRHIGGGHSKPWDKTPLVLKWHDGQNPLDTKEGVVKTPSVCIQIPLGDMKKLHSS